MKKTSMSICSREIRSLAVLVVTALVAATCTRSAHAQAGGGQTHIQVGGFDVQFWDQGDNGGSGANEIIGTIADADLGTWTADERAAIIRSFQYWSDILDLPDRGDGNRPVVRVIKDDSAVNFNANALPVWDNFFTDFTPGTGNIVDRLINNGNPTRVDGIDARLVFEAGQTGGIPNQWGTDPTLQLTTQDLQLEPVSIHEIGHILGINSIDLAHLNNVVADEATGPNAVAVFGGTGVPLAPGDPAHTNLQYHNHTRGQPFGLSFRNIPHFAPAELAILADIGYLFPLNGTNGTFGSAFYQNGTAPITNATGFVSNVDYGMGVFIHADDHEITQTGDITATGFAATGIRITGRDIDTNGNMITLADGTTINVNGEFGIGILASSGSNQNIVVRGDINALGTDGGGVGNGRGLVFDFGPNLITGAGQVDSTDYGFVLVEQVDITGSINASQNAIHIGDTAAVGIINIMNNATRDNVITGDIVSDALTSIAPPLGKPTLTFGFLADATTGVSTGAPDAGFTFTFNDNITDVAGTGSAVLDLLLAGGTTTFTNVVSVEDIVVDAATLNAAGTSVFTGTSLTVEDTAFGFAAAPRAVVNVDGQMTINGRTTVSEAGEINVSAIATFNGVDLSIDGSIFDPATFNSSGQTAFSGNVFLSDSNSALNILDGTMSADQVLQSDGVTTIDGTLNTRRYTLDESDFGTSTLDVNGPGGELNITEDLAMREGTVATIADGATLTAGSVDNDAAALQIDGTADVAGTFNTTNAGTTTIGATGTATAGTYTQSSGATTTVDAGGLLTVGPLTPGNVQTNDSTFDIQGTMSVNGSFGQVNGTTTVAPAAAFDAIDGSLVDATFTTGGTADFSGDVVASGSTVTVNPTGTLTALSLDQSAAGTLTVDAGGSAMFGSVVTDDSTTSVSGTLDVTNTYRQVAGSTIVNNGGSLDAGTYTQEAGQTTVQMNGSLNGDDINVLNGVVTVVSGANVTGNNYTQTNGTTDLQTGGAIDLTAAAAINGGLFRLNGDISSDSFNLGSQARLEGTGSITVANGTVMTGQIAPGNSIGTITNIGDLTIASPARYEVEIDATGQTPGVHNDLLSVTGQTTVDGGTVQLFPQNLATFEVGSRYTIIDSGSLTVNTLFTVEESIDFRRIIQITTPSTYDLLFARDVAYSTLGTTPNRTSVGTYLDLVTGNAAQTTDPTIVPANPAAFQLIRDLIDATPNPADAARALDQISGEAYGTLQTSLVQANSMFLDMIVTGTHGAGGRCCGSFSTSPQGTGFWTTGYGWVGDDQTDGNANAADYQAEGTAIGYNERLSNDFLAGVFYGFENLEMEVDGVRSRIDSETHRVGTFLEFRKNTYYVRTTAAAGVSSHESNRIIGVIGSPLPFAARTSADFDSWHGMADLEAGFCASRDMFKFEPLLGVRYMHISQEQFTETGSPVADLGVVGANIDALRVRAGGRFSTSPFGFDPIELMFDAFWQMDVLDTAGDITSTLRADGVNTFTVDGIDMDPSRVTLSPAIRTRFGQNVSLFGRYRADFSSGSNRQAGEGGVEIWW